jgi:hypothetical protein
MTVQVPLLFIDPRGNYAGIGIGNDGYQGMHRVAYLNDRCLTGPVKICRLQLQFSGYVGSTCTGAVLISVDKKKYSSIKSLYPLTQNTDYFQQMQIGQMEVNRQALNKIWLADIELNHPIEYVPGEDCIVICADMSGTSIEVQMLVWMPSLLMDTTPTWPTDDAPNDMPDWDCAAEIAASRQGGNDWYTRLYLRGDEMVNDSPSFQDRSWRNYTVRYIADVRLKDGWYKFTTSGIITPETYAPGFADDEDETHIDWYHGGDFTWDVEVKPSTISNSYGPILTFGKLRGPLILAQRNDKYHFYSTSASTVWNVAENYEFGTAVADMPTLLSVERYGNTLSVYQDGVLKHSWTDLSGPLFCPLFASGLPNCRPVFGAQADITREVTADAQAGRFMGGMRRIRFSKIARYHATSFTPPTAAYTP